MQGFGQETVMPELDPERLAIAAEVQRQIAAENTLTPVQARAFVRGLQTVWRVPTIQWGQTESHAQLADAKRLLNAADIFLSVQGPSSASATSVSYTHLTLPTKRIV